MINDEKNTGALESEVISEMELATLLSCERGALAKLRRSSEWNSCHYKVSPGGTIVWKKNCLQRVLRALGIEVKSFDKTPQFSLVLYEESILTARVVKVHSINTKLLDCDLFGDKKNPDGTRIRVRVRDNKNFIPDMEIKGVRLDGDLYTYLGKLPRSRGRW